MTGFQYIGALRINLNVDFISAIFKVQHKDKESPGVRRQLRFPLLANPVA